MSKFLFDEPPLCIPPSLIKIVGIEKAIILQQIHYACQQPRSGKCIDGEQWVWNTYAEWQESYFNFWSEGNIQKHFLRLEKEGWLLSCQPNLQKGDATKFYRVNTDKVSGGHGLPESMMGSTGVDHVYKDTKTSTNTIPTSDEKRPRDKTLWDEMVALFVSQGSTDKQARGLLGRLIKESDAKTVEQCYQRFKSQIEQSANAFPYFKTLLKDFKVESDAGKELLKWKRYHQSVYQGEVTFRPEMYGL